MVCFFSHQPANLFKVKLILVWKNSKAKQKLTAGPINPPKKSIEKTHIQLSKHFYKVFPHNLIILISRAWLLNIHHHNCIIIIITQIMWPLPFQSEWVVLVLTMGRWISHQGLLVVSGESPLRRSAYSISRHWRMTSMMMTPAPTSKVKILCFSELRRRFLWGRVQWWVRRNGRKWPVPR